VSKSKCPGCGALSIRSGATKCPSCQAWVQPPKFARRRLRLSPIGVIVFTVSLCIVGMVSGVVAAVTAQGRKAAPRLVEPSINVEVVAASSVATTVSAAPSSSAVAVSVAADTTPDVTRDPPAAEGKFVKTQQVRLDAPPASVLFSADESLFFVLVEDGTVRAHDSTTGAEKRRVKLPGRGKSLMSLPGARIAVLGLPADLLVIDEAGWAGGSSEAEFLKRVAIRDVIDIVAVGDPPRVVAVTGQGGRIVRLSSDFSAIEAEFVSVPPVQSLATIRAGGVDRLVMLASGPLPADTGCVFISDPTLDPFGASRASWSAVTDPRVSYGAGSDKLLMFDAATATVIDFSVDAERRVAPSGLQPMAAFRWFGDRAVVVGIGGDAAVVSLGRRVVQSTISLGAVPSAAVATPDRRVVVVALGGGLRGRGAQTVVLAGEPLEVESTVDTGDGSHLVTIAPKGSLVAVGAIAGRTVTLLARK
jgi:hypothetical protein